MSDSQSYFDRFKHKLKHRLNKHMDRMHNKMKFDTEGKKENNNKPLPKRNPIKEETAGKVFSQILLKGLTRVILILIIGVNIVYLVRNPAKLYAWFPIHCSKYPFGNKLLHPCGDGLTEEKIQKIEKILMSANYKKGGSSGQKGGGVSLIQNFINGPANKNDPNFPPSFPYSYYKNPESPDLSTGSDFFNWIISSLAISSTDLNYSITNIVTNETLKNLPDFVIMVLGFLLVMIKPLVFFYTFIDLMYRQFLGLFQRDFSTLILILFIGVFVILFDFIVGIYDLVAVLCKIFLYPFLTNPKGVLEIFVKQSHVIAFLVGAVFIYALLYTPFNKDYSTVIKVIPTIIYIIFLLAALQHYLYKK